jgi:hypothetical protein
MKNCVYAQVGTVRESPLLEVYGLNEERLITAELTLLRERWQSTLRGI